MTTEEDTMTIQQAERMFSIMLADAAATAQTRMLEILSDTSYDTLWDTEYVSERREVFAQSSIIAKRLKMGPGIAIQVTNWDMAQSMAERLKAEGKDPSEIDIAELRSMHFQLINQVYNQLAHLDTLKF